MQKRKMVEITKHKDEPNVTFNIFQFTDDNQKVLTHTFNAEYEVTDHNEDWSDDEYKAYMPISQCIVYMMFNEGEPNEPADKFLKSVCLAMFVQDYDQARMF